MSLGVHSITIWGQMKEAFLGKCKDYCLPTNRKEEVFKVTQKEDENLEDLVERFFYNVKREEMDNLDEETLKPLLLKAIKADWINFLNLTRKGDITQLPLLIFFIYVYRYQGVNHELEGFIDTLSCQ